MKSKLLQLSKMLLVVVCLLVGASSAWADNYSANVKMTWVDYDNPDTAMGEVETAQAGFNKISNGEVGFDTPSWKCNWITYLQVDASNIPNGATITDASLTFKGSGSTDSKRTTGWGVGYNNSTWSADMTYNTADKSITTIGGVKWTATKSATVFESFTFDITEALKNAEGKVATILVYETAAAGGYVKEPVVTVTYTTEQAYKVTFTETNGVSATVKMNGTDITNGTTLPNGTYQFTATATGYKDYEGSFTVAGADKNVEFTMEEKAIYSYTVKGVGVDGTDFGIVNNGSTGYADENVTYYYPEFVQVGTTLYMKKSNGSNPYWGATGMLDTDNKVFTVTYGDGTINNVVFYKEAEEMEGFTAKTTNNAPIRCSNGIGGIVDGEQLLTTLPAGKYKIFGQVWGTTGLTAGVKANGVDVWTLASTGSLANSTSEEFELKESTGLYVYTTGGNDNHMLDLIYIEKTGDATVEVTIAAGKEFATFNSDYALDFTNVTDLTAYTAKLNATEGTVTLTKVEDAVAQTGLLIRRASKEMSEALTVNVPVAANATVHEENAFKAITKDEYVKEGYVLATVNEVQGFYKANSTDGTLVAKGKAYLPAPANGSESRLTMVFDDETTGINETVVNKKQATGTYNLNGQRVEQPTKGLYIVNGKKVVIK